MNFTPPLPLPPDPPWFDDLLGEVARAFDETGASTPGWPDPHPDRVAEEDEYSRVTDPAKYRILDTRLDAWVRVLAARGIATASDVPATNWRAAVRRPAAFDSVQRLTPRASGGLSLLLARTLVDGEPFGLDLGLVQGDAQPLLLRVIPDCGCDACDSGSADLLEELDGWFLTVARGGAIAAESSNGSATRHVGGWEWSGECQEPEVWLDDSAPCPPGVTRWVGEPWL